jgi:hypothetical protein
MTPIIGLLSPRRPAAIAGFVIAIVVYSVECGPGWALTHVGKKIVEGHPAVAHRNPSILIPTPPVMFWVQASLLHPRPRSVRRRDFSAPATRMAMTRARYSFVVLAAATECVFPRQIVANDDGCISTVADALPAGVSGLGVSEPLNCQAPETMPCEIAECAHV